ncbi:MAG: DUF4115 domain-containing protein [Syntrophomonadaceae bacterium]|jgi:cytoskeletal protein RodZ|nr:DUF4115 domain-containing protein [Syntrophomonadaceae bacterium]
MDLGSFLRETRIELGISIEAVEEETKIRKYYIEALENNDFEVLPPQVYACGFVKRYAKLLGLDPTEAVSVFSELAYGKNDSADADFAVSNNATVYKDINKIDNKSRRFSTKSIVFALVFLVAVIWLGNNLLNYMVGSWREKDDINNISPPQQTVTEYEDEQTAEKPEADTETPEVPALYPEGVSVDVEITAQCWLTVVVDGEQVLAQILQAGEQRNFQGQKSVYLKAGNAGGIIVKHEEEVYAPLGVSGSVIERTFTAD